MLDRIDMETWYNYDAKVMLLLLLLQLEQCFQHCLNAFSVQTTTACTQQTHIMFMVYILH